MIRFPGESYVDLAPDSVCCWLPIGATGEAQKRHETMKRLQVQSQRSVLRSDGLSGQSFSALRSKNDRT